MSAVRRDQFFVEVLVQAIRHLVRLSYKEDAQLRMVRRTESSKSEGGDASGDDMQTIFNEWSSSTTEWESGRLTSFGVEDDKEELLKQLTMLKSTRARRNNAVNSSNVRRVPTVLSNAGRRWTKN